MKFNWITGAFLFFAVIALFTATDVYPGVESWTAFGVFLALAVGFAIAAKRHDDKIARREGRTPGSSTFALAPFALQDSSATGSGWAGWEGGLTTFLTLAVVAALLIGGFMWLRKHRRSGNPGT